MKTQNETPVKPIETKPNPQKRQQEDLRRKMDQPDQKQKVEKKFDTMKTPDPKTPKSEFQNGIKPTPSETDPRVRSTEEERQNQNAKKETQRQKELKETQKPEEHKTKRV